MIDSYATTWHKTEGVNLKSQTSTHLEKRKQDTKNTLLQNIITSILISNEAKFLIGESLTNDLFEILKACYCRITEVDLEDDEIFLDAYYTVDEYIDIIIVLGFRSNFLSKFEVKVADNWIPLLDFFGARYQGEDEYVPDFQVDFGTGIMFAIDHFSKERIEAEDFIFRVNYNQD